MSLYSLHVEKWKDCQECNLCENPKRKVVIARGQVPCNVLFIGEAPGKSENSLGYPFAGPAGHLIDRIIFKAFRGIDKLLTYAMTNLVCCIPLNEDGTKASEPEAAEIMACAPRLREFYEMCLPQLKAIVCVGKLPAKWIETLLGNYPVPRVDIDHPAYILRANYAQQGLLEQRCVVTLQNALEDL